MDIMEGRSEADIIRQGLLGIVKKQGVEPRYFVLYEDKLIYFVEQNDFVNGDRPPRGCINVGDILRIEDLGTEDGGFVVHLVKQSVPFQPLDEDEEEEGFVPWIDCIIGLVDPGEEVIEEEAEEEEGVYDEPLENDEENVQPAEAEPESKDLEADDGPTVCKGPLSVSKKGKLKQRYFVLTHKRLTYYEDSLGAGCGETARGCIVLNDIVKFEERSLGFSVTLTPPTENPNGEGIKFDLVSNNEEDQEMWMIAWEDLLLDKLGDAFITDFEGEEEEEPEIDIDVEPQVDKPNTKARMSYASETDSGRESLSIPADAGAVMFQGSLYVVKEKQESIRYVVLFEDRLEYYSTPEAFDGGERPRVRVNVADIQSLEITGEGLLVLTLQDRAIRLRVDGTETIVEWGTALQDVLVEIALSIGQVSAEVIWDPAVQPDDEDDENEQANELQRDDQEDAAEEVVMQELAPEDLEPDLNQLALEQLEPQDEDNKRDGAIEEVQHDELEHAVDVADEDSQQEQLQDEFKKQVQERKLVSHRLDAVQTSFEDPSALTQPQELTKPVKSVEQLGKRETQLAKANKNPPKVRQITQISARTPSCLCKATFLAEYIGTTSFCTNSSLPPMQIDCLQGTHQFILHDDKLECRPASDGATPAPLTCNIMLDDLEDLEVFKNGFLLHLAYGSLRITSTSATHAEFETWLDALSSIFQKTEDIAEVNAPQEFLTLPVHEPHVVIRSPPPTKPSRPICFGFMYIERGQHEKELNHVALYYDRLEICSAADSQGDKSAPLQVFLLSDLHDFRIAASGFEVWTQVTHERLTLRVRHQSEFREWLRAMTRVFGGGDMLNYSLPTAAPKVEMDIDTEVKKPQPVKKWSEMPQTPQSTSSSSSTPCLKPFSAKGASAKPPIWTDEDAKVRKKDIKLQGPSLSVAELEEEAADPRFLEWVNALKECPVRMGVLGLQKQGRLVMNYCILFAQRLDIWTRPFVAHREKGERPQGCIRLADVRSLEIVSGGFILNFAGRKTAIHVPHSDQFNDWSSSLVSLITAIKADDDSDTNAMSKRQSEQVRPQSAGTRRGPDWVPRVANVSTKSSTAHRSSSKSSEEVHSRPSLLTNRALGTGLGGRGITVNPHKGAHMLHGELYGFWQQGHDRIAQKVNECSRNAGVPRQVASDIALADKVTGQRACRTPAPSVTGKVTGHGTPQAPISYRVADKVTGVGLQTAARSPSRDAYVAGKITGH